MNRIPVISLFHPTPTMPTPVAPPPTTIPAPLSYEFRVVEWMKEGKIERVGLQVKINQHDQYGNRTIEGPWTDVPREQINME